jgi:hypothetical protein
MTQTTFDDVYAEVKKLNKRLDSMEKTLRALMTMILPEEELTQAEWDELKEIEAEMKRGECTSLSELTKKYGAA